MESPENPISNFSVTPCFVPTPPAEIIGRLQFLEMILNSSSEDRFPACPPAFLFTAITASAPSSSTFLAYFSSATSQNTFMPLGLHCWITCLGLPSEVMIKSTPNFTQLSNCLFTFMFDLFTIRFIPNPPEVVLFLISFIAFSSSSIVRKFKAGIQAAIPEFIASIIIFVLVTKNIGAIIIGYSISSILFSSFILKFIS